MKKFFLFLWMILLTIACSKDSTPIPEVPCEAENWGHLRIKNTQTPTYDILIDGAYQGTLESGESLIVEPIPARFIHFHAKEPNCASGFVIETFLIQPCRINDIEF